MLNIADAVLGVLADAGKPLLRANLHILVNRQLHVTVADSEFTSTLDQLVGQRVVSISASGNVHLLQSLSVTPVGPNAEGANQPSERQLMGHLRQWLDQRFRLSLGDRSLLRDTSAGGPAWGLWSKPDFTVAFVRRYEFSSAREVDLYGFELKKAGAATVISVHEALAHTRWVNFSYLVVHVPEPLRASERLSLLRDECARVGIGLVTFCAPADYDTWAIALEPQRQQPDPNDVDKFILSRFADDDRDRLKNWLSEA